MASESSRRTFLKSLLVMLPGGAALLLQAVQKSRSASVFLKRACSTGFASMVRMTLCQPPKRMWPPSLDVTLKALSTCFRISWPPRSTGKSSAQRVSSTRARSWASRVKIFRPRCCQRTCPATLPNRRPTPLARISATLGSSSGASLPSSPARSGQRTASTASEICSRANISPPSGASSGDSSDPARSRSGIAGPMDSQSCRRASP
mmetsp:Transcript_13354/g.39800  ORF Transcript_13354/g.39800 Transcript_13354/m.39800 type:complete len:206 (+) Transcript_13354:922-1539(+)